MKSISLLKTVFLFLISISFITCTKDDTPVMDSEKSIVEIVNTNPDFSILRAAIVKAGLTTTLQGTGPFTVFAPNNAAFQKAGFINVASIESVPVETLKNILLYHTVASKTTSSMLPTAINTPIESVQGADLFITKDNQGVFINGASVINADITAKNGVIHIISDVLMSPSGDLVESLAGDSNFSFLVAAVVRASQGTTDVKSVLENSPALTLFAPTNQAFMNAGFSNIQAIEAADPATLTTILTGHVVEGNVFSNAVQNNMNVLTLGQSNLMFSVGNGVTVKGTGNSVASNITTVNWLTSNGVIHIIDQVLLP